MWEVDCLDDDGNRDPTKMETMRPRLIVKCLVDESGHRLFSDDEAVDVGDWPATFTVKLFEACSDMCGFDDEDKKEFKKKYD